MPKQIEIPSGLFRELVALAWIATRHECALGQAGITVKSASDTAQAAQHVLDRFDRA